MSNTLGFFICLVYIFGAIGVAEGLRRWRGYSSDFTRKAIHIAVGMLTWALPWLFSSLWPFVIAGISFAILNFLDWRLGIFDVMTSGDRSNLGTVYFPLAAIVVVVYFWDSPPLMVAAMMPLTWGDGLAPIIGRAFGKREYTVWGHTRTLAGSLTFFVAAWLFTGLALWLMPGMPALSVEMAIMPAFIVALLTTFTEAVSIWGLDNLTVTAVAAIVLTLWPF